MFTPPGLDAPPWLSGSAIPLSPHLTVFDADKFLENEEEFEPPPNAEEERRRKVENLARGLHQLPLAEQTRIVEVVQNSIHLASHELDTPANFHWVIRKQPNATVPPAYRLFSCPPADKVELARYFAQPNRNWLQMDLAPGEAPPDVCSNVFIVHIEGKDNRVVVNCVAGNLMADQHPTVRDELNHILPWLANPSRPFLISADLSKAFKQILVLDEHRLYWVKFEGKYYQPLRLPTGSTAAPYVLHKAMEKWFASVLGSTFQKYPRPAGPSLSFATRVTPRTAAASSSRPTPPR